MQERTVGDEASDCDSDAAGLPAEQGHRGHQQGTQ